MHNHITEPYRFKTTRIRTTHANIYSVQAPIGYDTHNYPTDIVALALSSGPRLSYMVCNLNECVHL